MQLIHQQQQQKCHQMRQLCLGCIFESSGQLKAQANSSSISDTAPLTLQHKMTRSTQLTCINTAYRTLQGHRAVSLRQHGFLVLGLLGARVKAKQAPISCGFGKLCGVPPQPIRGPGSVVSSPARSGVQTYFWHITIF